MSLKVSVIIPIFNGEKYLEAAIDSILKQTFNNYELLLIDDGSTDKTLKIISTYKDKRIRLLKNDHNMGLAVTRNRGIDESKGEYIAWLDCDDISLPTRLEKQVTVLDENPDIGLCGTWVKTIGGESGSIWKYPVEPDFLRSTMIFYNPLATSSIMLKKKFLIEHNLRFDLLFPPAEDYDLWERLSNICKITNVPKVLTLHRTHSAQISCLMAEKQKKSAWKVQERQINTLSIVPDEGENQLHLTIGINWQFCGARGFVESSKEWFEKLDRNNKELQVYKEPAFSMALSERFYAVCSSSAGIGLPAFFIFCSSPLHLHISFKSLKLLKLFMKCALKLQKL